MKKKIN